MKILKIIHGYPPQYNAGSEVYSQMLCHELVQQHTVTVLTREENAFKPAFSYRISHDPIHPNIEIHFINIPNNSFRYSYRNQPFDQYCETLIKQYHPDIVHIGHLNHLSLSALEVFHQNNLPIIYTLHDFWLMCPRGQFIQRNSIDTDCWALCSHQQDDKCAKNCYAGYFSGAEEDYQDNVSYWTEWVRKRMQYVKQVMPVVDKFIAPSQYLRKRFINDFNIPEDKIIYLDYGFDLSRFKSSTTHTKNKNSNDLVFGYIGTHIPAKGIHHLINAFAEIDKDARLIIWGRPRGHDTNALIQLSNELPLSKQFKIEWRNEYSNENIMRDVFQHIDCLVVPSVWVENSPLVIHEAIQARIPVITANVGGMAELVQHKVNGLHFNHRNSNSLATQMQRLLNEPLLLNKLKQGGYLYSDNKNVISISEHVKQIEMIYHDAITTRKQ